MREVACDQPECHFAVMAIQHPRLIQIATAGVHSKIATKGGKKLTEKCIDFPTRSEYFVTAVHFSLELPNREWNAGRMDASDSNANNRLVAELHSALADQLKRVAWAVLRDWDLAADAVQETFILFSEKLTSIAPHHHRGWLFKTVQFTAMNLRKSRKRADRLVDQFRETKAEYASHAPPPDDAGIGTIRNAIDRLPEDQRRIVMLRLAGEKTFAQIADELQLPIGTVLSRMRLALTKLRQTVNNEGLE